MKNKNIFKLLLLATATFCFISCKKQAAISEGNIIDNNVSLSGNISKLYINAGAQESNFGGFVDTYTGKLYLGREVNENFHNIDLYFRYTKSSGNELFSTNFNESVFLNSDLEKMQYAWPYRNRGDFFILKNASEAQLKAFDSITNKTEIGIFYNEILGFIGNPAPVQRLTNLIVNDVILFRSSTKNTTSIIKVVGTANNINGRLALDVKTDISNRNIVPKATANLSNTTKPADIIELSFDVANGDENFIDLKNRKVYKEHQLPVNGLSDIAIIHTFNGALAAPRQSLFAPGSGFVDDNYSQSLYDWLQLQTNKRNVLLLSVSSVSPSHADLGVLYNLPGNNFDQLRHNNDDLKTAANTLKHPSGSTWSHATTLAEGMVLKIEDRTSGDVGFVKIIELDNIAKTMKIAVKYMVEE
jgi:hypothetical protein